MALFDPVRFIEPETGLVAEGTNERGAALTVLVSSRGRGAL